MKNKKIAVAVLMLALSQFFAFGQDLNKGLITILPFVTVPVKDSSYEQALDRVIKKGTSAFVAGDPATDPTAYQEVDHIEAKNISSSNDGQQLWDATNNATGAFAGQTGKGIGVPFVIQNKSGTRLSNLKVRVSENGFPAVLNKTVGYAGTNYVGAVGSNWGPDGVVGTADDTTTDPFTPTSTIVNKAEAMIVLSYGGKAATVTSSVANHMAAVNPFIVTLTFELYSDDGQTVIDRVTVTLSSSAPTRLLISKTTGGALLTITGNNSVENNIESAPTSNGPWTVLGTIKDTAVVHDTASAQFFRAASK